jgi:anti-sigma regulatory factor (Ser/Thr protein kinase)
MNNRERGERIRFQILRDVKHHPGDISKHIGTIFSISPQAVNSHIKRLENEGWLASSGIGKGKRYFLGDLRKYHSYFPFSSNQAEDQIWRDHYSFIFEGLPENVVDICHYGFTEMVNNAIDHSGGEGAYLSIERNSEKIVIYVIDDGEGIFKRIKRLCELPDERQAILELSKGKLTTDPDRHTGEGIFFTSRAFDQFEIDSMGLTFSHNDDFDYDFLNESEISAENVGTLVYMSLQRNSGRDIQEVFDRFTAGPDEFQFNKTIIPVRLAQYENEKLVSRSQAKRMLTRIEWFQNVIFDFEGVTAIGQAFADEIFRVYAYAHPDIALVPVKMEENVSKMVMKATSALEAQLKK